MAVANFSPALLRPHWLAASVAVLLHGGLLTALLANWHPDLPPAPALSTLQTRLITLPPPAPEPVVLSEPVPEVPPPPKPKEKTKQAELAQKRVEPEPVVEPQPEPEPMPPPEQRPEHLAEPAPDTAPAEAPPQLASLGPVTLEDLGGSYRPLTKQPPSYPGRALDRELEGDCTIRYTVNTQGQVENPTAESDCHPLFIQPSLAAARGFRYQPHKVNGQPVPVTGVRNTFHYRIQR